MGDKGNELFGNPMLFIGTPLGDMKLLGKVVDNSTRLNPEDAAELDRLSVREKMLSRPMKVGPISFDFQMPMDDNLVSLLGADFASEPSKQGCSLIIESEPIINKPKDLKYPNKKRARRIWKKWKRRFGTTPGKCLYLPNVDARGV